MTLIGTRAVVHKLQDKKCHISLKIYIDINKSFVANEMVACLSKGMSEALGQNFLAGCGCDKQCPLKKAFLYLAL